MSLRIKIKKPSPLVQAPPNQSPQIQDEKPISSSMVPQNPPTFCDNLQKEFHFLDPRYKFEQTKALNSRNAGINLNSKIEKNNILIFDHGSYQIRAGFSFCNEPNLITSSLIGKFRKNMTTTMSSDCSKALKAKSQNLLIGNELDPEDYSRIPTRTPFEGEFALDMEDEEHILDYAFDQIFSSNPKLRQSKQNLTNFPMLMTEPIANLNSARGLMSEMLFESYDIPNVIFAIDALLSYYLTNSSQNGMKSLKNGFIIRSGHCNTHAFPFLNQNLLDFQLSDAFSSQVVKKSEKNETFVGPLMSCSKRIGLGGSNLTDFSLKLMQVKYPNFLHHWGEAEQFKEQFCEVSNFETEENNKNNDDSMAQFSGFSNPFDAKISEIFDSETKFALETKNFFYSPSVSESSKFEQLKQKDFAKFSSQIEEKNTTIDKLLSKEQEYETFMKELQNIQKDKEEKLKESHRQQKDLSKSEQSFQNAQDASSSATIDDIFKENEKKALEKEESKKAEEPRKKRKYVRKKPLPDKQKAPEEPRKKRKYVRKKPYEKKNLKKAPETKETEENQPKKEEAPVKVDEKKEESTKKRKRKEKTKSIDDSLIELKEKHAKNVANFQILENEEKLMDCEQDYFSALKKLKSSLSKEINELLDNLKSKDSEVDPLMMLDFMQNQNKNSNFQNIDDMDAKEKVDNKKDVSSDPQAENQADSQKDNEENEEEGEKKSKTSYSKSRKTKGESKKRLKAMAEAINAAEEEDDEKSKSKKEKKITKASKKGKKPENVDNFGAKDEDWDVYNEINSQSVKNQARFGFFFEDEEMEEMEKEKPSKLSKHWKTQAKLKEKQKILKELNEEINKILSHGRIFGKFSKKGFDLGQNFDIFKEKRVRTSEKFSNSKEIEKKMFNSQYQQLMTSSGVIGGVTSTTEETKNLSFLTTNLENLKKLDLCSQNLVLKNREIWGKSLGLSEDKMPSKIRRIETPIPKDEKKEEKKENENENDIKEPKKEEKKPENQLSPPNNEKAEQRSENPKKDSNSNAIDIQEIQNDIKILRKKLLEEEEKKSIILKRSTMSFTTEKFRIPEAIFQPQIFPAGRKNFNRSAVGVAELVENVVKTLQNLETSDIVSEILKNLFGNIFVCGGNSLFPGFKNRIQSEIQTILPPDVGRIVKVFSEQDSVSGPWKGGKKFFEDNSMDMKGFLEKFSISKSDYQEMGQNYLKEHFLGNWKY